MRTASFILGALIGLASFANAVFVQKTAAAKKTEPCYARAYYGTDEYFVSFLHDAKIEIATRYGNLTVPMREIALIEVGLLSMPKKMRMEIISRIKNLGDESYRVREKAEVFLMEVGPAASSFLRRAEIDGLEARTRASNLAKRIASFYPKEYFMRREEDLVQTIAFPIEGRIIGDAIVAHSAYHGKMEFNLSILKKLVFERTFMKTLSLDAKKHGSKLNAWCDAGIEVSRLARLEIKADGTVDLWPQGPGQYLAGPNGYKENGVNSPYRAGALLVKIGNGKEFLAGAEYKGVPGQKGKLYFCIVPSPWNNPSGGQYKVKVRTSFAKVVP